MVCHVTKNSTILSVFWQPRHFESGEGPGNEVAFETTGSFRYIKFKLDSEAKGT